MSTIHRAVVTGAAGFVGRHVALALSRQGVQTVGIGHGEPSSIEQAQWGLCGWHRVDLGRDAIPATLSVPDAVFHCGGGASVAASVDDPLNDFQRTVGGTAALLDHMRRHWPAASLVLPSSAGVYGDVPNMPISPSQRLQPASPYGLHKKIAEELCAGYGRLFGLRSAVVRLFSVFGNGLRKQLLWDACIKLSRGEANFAGTGDETRDWIHVEDAVALLVLAAEHAACVPAVVNAGSGRATRIADVVELLARRLGSSKEPFFTGQTRPGDPLHYEADIAAALAWGWRPVSDRVSQMEAYVDWFREADTS